LDRIRNLLSTLDLPREALGGVYSVTITGNNEIQVNECGNIVKYEDGELFLQLSDRILKVYGLNLTMKTYFGNSVLIHGRISKIEFED
jgi:YabP family.